MNIVSHLNTFISVHQKFTTPKTDQTEAIFRFKKNSRQFNTRVFSKDFFNITFSKTKQQQNNSLVISFFPNLTRIKYPNTVELEEEPYFVFGNLNELTLKLTASSLIIINSRFSEFLNISGNFNNFGFIGFNSENHTSWIVSESKKINK